MRYLKLFEAFSNSSFESTQEFLDDLFAELLDGYSFQEGNSYDLTDGRKDRVYFYQEHEGNMYIIFLISEKDPIKQELIEKVMKIFKQKINTIYPTSKITSNISNAEWFSLKLAVDPNNSPLNRWNNDLDWSKEKEMYKGVSVYRFLKDSISLTMGEGTKERVNFTESEIKRIKSKFGVMGLNISAPWDEWILISDKEDKARPYQSKIVIFKLRDDYYLVYSFNKPWKFEFVSGNIIGFISQHGGRSRQYLCDQFEGLEYLLKRLLVESFDRFEMVEESFSQNPLQKAQEFLDDVFLGVLDEWGIQERTSNDHQSKVYNYYQNPISKRVSLSIMIGTIDLVTKKVNKDKDLMSELRHIFKTKVEPVYPKSAIESNITIDPQDFEPYFRISITIEI